MSASPAVARYVSDGDRSSVAPSGSATFVGGAKSGDAHGACPFAPSSSPLRRPRLPLRCRRRPGPLRSRRSCRAVARHSRLRYRLSRRPRHRSGPRPAPCPPSFPRRRCRAWSPARSRRAARPPGSTGSARKPHAARIYSPENRESNQALHRRIVARIGSGTSWCAAREPQRYTGDDGRHGARGPRRSGALILARCAPPAEPPPAVGPSATDENAPPGRPRPPEAAPAAIAQPEAVPPRSLGGAASALAALPAPPPGR